NVKDNVIIARGHNLREQKAQAFAHAELVAIQKASKKLGNQYLIDCDLYVTLEPCMMCAGLISQARIHGLYYGASDEKGGMVNSLIDLKKIKHVGAYPREIEAGIEKEMCGNILSTFFREKRKKTK
ncbi:MAG: nucleoside deaminase, partial [Solobacterium sp.]|nr:nucleoside deaminase [Solobacterium sp.]